MTEKKVRILFFTLGLAVGIIVGASVVKVYSDKVNAETSVSKNFVSRLFSNIVGLVYKPKKQSTDSITQGTIANSDTKTNQTSSSSNVNLDNSQNAENNTPDTINSEPSKQDKTDDVVVLSDKLIATSRLQIIDFKQDKSKKDSISSASAGKKVSVYAIEFWQSPLNYRGYKTQKNKIILYGINKDESLKLIRLNDKLFLKFQNQFSVIESHSDFHSFEKVNDSQVLTILNGL